MMDRYLNIDVFMVTDLSFKLYDHAHHVGLEHKLFH